MTLTENARNFLACKPTLIGTVCDEKYYEHPQFGDEVPLWKLTKTGRIVRTEEWELPDELEWNVE